MSRDIQFRAWDTLQEAYVKSAYAAEEPRIDEHGVCMIGMPSYWVIEQFTGLKDRNGRDIYEGDILKASVIINRITDGVFLVRWNDYLGNWALDWKGEQAKQRVTNPTARGLQNPYKDWDTDFAKLTGAKSAKMAVIGNIHENPDLLSS